MKMNLSFERRQNRLFSEDGMERFTVTGIQQLTVGESKRFLERHSSAHNSLGRRYQRPDSLQIGLRDICRTRTEHVRLAR
jgi:hypothetical protein